MNSIIVPFHRYTVLGKEYYQPIYDYFIGRMTEYRHEFDRLFLLDSTWGIKGAPGFATVIKVDPSLRYYDAYKKVLPQLPDGNVLFLDNDMVIYRPNIIESIFKKLDEYGVVSIYDTCGTYRTDKLNGENKFCPYLFAASKNLLMKYRDIEWGPGLPEHETLGMLTIKMLEDRVKSFELAEDKNSIYIEKRLLMAGSYGPLERWRVFEDGMSKDLGYYHIRAGSVPAYLLSTIKYGDVRTYWDYIKTQPAREYLRQFAWYWYMKGSDRFNNEVLSVIEDVKMTHSEWVDYIDKFKKYHNLP